jgi:biopolymer transport protein ExbB/TolQ
MGKKEPRPNKSKRIADELTSMADRQVVAANPWEKKFKAAASHIRWLELIVTGLSHKDRNTIVKMMRRRELDKKMIERRDQKIGEHKDKITILKAEHREKIKELKALHEAVLNDIQGIQLDKLEGIREAIEREFIMQLQTSRKSESNKTLKVIYKSMYEDSRKAAYDRYYNASNHSGTSATTY